MGESCRGAHGNCGSTNNQGPTAQVVGQLSRGAVHMAQVRGTGPFLLRGSHAEEVNVAELAGLLEGGTEPETAGFQRLREQLREPRSKNGNTPEASCATLCSSTSTPSTSYPSVAKHTAWVAPR